MKRALHIILAAWLALSAAYAQQSRTVQNRPYTDLRPFHFGILVGTHLQDLTLVNAGPQTIIGEDGSETTRLITTDQDRWDNGFNVGVLGELRLNRSFQLRIAPSMLFGVRHLLYKDHTAPAIQPSTPDTEGSAEAQTGITINERTQTLKTVYISCAADLIFGSQRNGNVRPYMMAGLNPVINLSGNESDIIKLKRNDLYFEVGAGCDFYMPFFKLRPELKFMFGLTDCLDRKHAANLRDENLRAFANAATKATSNMIVLTFYFE